MALFSDLDVLKEIPGYHAIMRGVVKSIIQILIEQLSAQTGEESVILTASINDGTLSHLGSESGKTFLEENEDIKSKFLGFCLQRQHKIQSTESKQSKESEKAMALPGSIQKITPGRKVANQRRAGLSPSSPYTPMRKSTVASVSSNYTEQSPQFIDSALKPEPAPSYPSTTETPYTQTIDQDQQDSSSQEDNSTGDNPAEITIIKQEPLDEEIEYTGTEFDNSMGQDQGETSFDQNQLLKNATESWDYFNMNNSASGGDLSGAGKSYNMVIPREISTLMMTKQHKSFKCETCDKAFLRSCDRNRHRKIHSGDKPFSCSVCNRKFSRRDNMRSHMLVHHQYVKKLQD